MDFKLSDLLTSTPSGKNITITRSLQACDRTATEWLRERAQIATRAESLHLGEASIALKQHKNSIESMVKNP